MTVDVKQLHENMLKLKSFEIANLISQFLINTERNKLNKDKVDHLIKYLEFAIHKEFNQ